MGVRRNQRWSPQDREQLRRLASKKMTAREIAVHVERSVQAVQQKALELGLVLKRSEQRPRSNQLASG